MFPSVMAAVQRVGDQNHEKQKGHSDGDEELRGHEREAKRMKDGCGCCTCWDAQKGKKKKSLVGSFSVNI